MTSSHLPKRREFVLGESLLARRLLVVSHLLAAMAIILLLPAGVWMAVASSALALSAVVYFLPLARQRLEARRVWRLDYRENMWTLQSCAGACRGELAGFKLSTELVLLKLRLEQGRRRRVAVFRDQLSADDWRQLRVLLAMS